MIICSPQLGLSPEANLGGEVYDREMIKALDALGMKTLIILPCGKKYPPLKHAKVYFLPVPFVYPPWLFNLLVLPYLFFLYRKYQFEVLRVHSPYFVGPVAVLFKIFNPKVKVVASYLHLEPNDKFYNLVDRNLINHYSAVTAISETTKENLVKRYGVNPQKIAVIPCGVNSKYKPKAKSIKLVQRYGLRKKKVLLYLGQLISRKNIPFLFEVLKKLPENYVLMICGTGPLRQELVNNSPDGVIFTGQISEKDKVDYYNLADVFVLPSRLEGFGLSVLEALACNKPAVVSDIPTFREIFKKQNGCTLVSLNDEKWVEAVMSSVTKNGTGLMYQDYSWMKSTKSYLKFVSP